MAAVHLKIQKILRGGGENNKAKGVPDEDIKETSSVDANVKIEEQVLVDQDGFKIVATGIEAGKRDNEVYLDIEVTNNTDKIYDIYTDTVVNGYVAIWEQIDEEGEQREAYLPGEVKGKIKIYGNALKYADIGKIGKIEFQDFAVREVEEEPGAEGCVYYDYKIDQRDNPFFKADNIMIQTDAVDEIKEVRIPEGEELYNENGIKLVKTNPEEAKKLHGIFFYRI